MKKILFILFSTFTYLISFSQISGLTTILDQDVSQGKKLIEAYFNPMSESFGAGLNNGWYNTAKPHRLGGFDLTLTLNTVIIPNSVKKFNIQAAGSSTFTSDEEYAESIFGSKETTKMYYNPNGNQLIGMEFDMPAGFNTKVMPIPMIQAGIGIIKNTEIDLRFMPMLNVGDNIKVNLFGVGLKHDLLQWIPAIGDVIPMSLSLQWGYTSLNTEVNIANQDVDLNTIANTINLTLSRKILMLTGYAGLGYNSAVTNFSADANFDLNGVTFEEKLEMNFESNNDFRANAGLRLNIALITLQADYTFSKYPTATLGLGVSIR